MVIKKRWGGQVTIFVSFFGIIGALAPQALSWRKRDAPVADSSDEASYLELQRVGMQVTLLLEVGEIVKAHVVIDAAYRDTQGDLASAITIDGVP
jgi:hypothetical protein